MQSSTLTAKSKEQTTTGIALNDVVILGAAFVSFLLSVSLWFGSSKEQGLFVGLWVPSIISLGVYFRLLTRGKHE